MQVFADAFTRAGSLDPQKVRDAIADHQDRQRSTDRSRFDSTGKNPAKDMIMLQVLQGSVQVVVAPTKWATDKVVYPRPREGRDRETTPHAEPSKHEALILSARSGERDAARAIGVDSAPPPASLCEVSTGSPSMADGSIAMDNIAILIQAPPLALQLLIDGVLIGSIFALAAYGMALVWGVMNIINVCQGEFVLLGGYVAFTLARQGLPPLLGVPVAAIVLVHPRLALLPHRHLPHRRARSVRLAARHLRHRHRAGPADEQHLQRQSARPSTPISATGSCSTAWSRSRRSRWWRCAVTFVIAAALVLFMRRSRLGQAIRATAQNARAARILGIDTDRIYAMTYALNAAICGASGALVAMIWVHRSPSAG